MTRGSTELFDCARVSDYLESYLSGQVPPPERRGMRLHIHGCVDCHRKVMERDPLQLFAPLADQEREAPGDSNGDPWEGFYDVIRSGIAVEEARSSHAPRVWLSAAAVVAMIALGLAAFYVATKTSRPVMMASDPRTPPMTQASLAPGPMPQTVERVRGTGAGDVQVYTMNYYQDEPATGRSTETEAPGSQGQTAELILIVDARLEL